jgi:hypothetical protein
MFDRDEVYAPIGFADSEDDTVVATAGTVQS